MGGAEADMLVKRTAQVQQTHTPTTFKDYI